MKKSTKEFVNPNTPFRFFRTFRDQAVRKGGSGDKVAVDAEHLRKLSLSLLDEPNTKSIFRRAGVHGDIGPKDEALISDFVESYVEHENWENPDPSDLVIATVLARQLAEGNTSKVDEEAQVEYINEKRVIDKIGSKIGEYASKFKVSEIFHLLQWLDSQEELKQPLQALRRKSFSRGQDFFEGEEADVDSFALIEDVLSQIAVNKYGFKNKDLIFLRIIVGSIVERYVTKELDHLDSQQTLNWILDRFPGRIENDILSVGGEYGPLS